MDNYLESEGHLSVDAASDLTRNDQAVNSLRFLMPVIEQVLKSEASLDVLSHVPSEPRIDSRVGRNLLTCETRDVIERSIQIKVAPKIEVRMQLELMLWIIAFGYF